MQRKSNHSVTVLTQRTGPSLGGCGCLWCCIVAHAPRVVAATVPTLVANHMEGALGPMAAVIAQHSHLQAHSNQTSWYSPVSQEGLPAASHFQPQRSHSCKDFDHRPPIITADGPATERLPGHPG